MPTWEKSLWFFFCFILAYLEKLKGSSFYFGLLLEKFFGALVLKERVSLLILTRAAAH